MSGNIPLGLLFVFQIIEIMISHKAPGIQKQPAQDSPDCCNKQL